MRPLHQKTDLVVPFGKAYKPYQEEGIRFMMSRAGALIADEPGLGKTIQAIGLANQLPDTFKVLVISPASLTANWEREWCAWDARGLTVGVIRDGKPESWLPCEVTIISVNLLHKHIEAIHEAGPWDVLVVDEAHTIKNPGSTRSVMVLGGKTDVEKKAKSKFKHPPIQATRRIFLTGTPVLNRPRDLWPLAHALAPKKFKNFFHFAINYCDAKMGSFGWNFDGNSNLDELRIVLESTFMIRRLKSQVLSDLPPKIRNMMICGQARTMGQQSAFPVEFQDEMVRAILDSGADGYERKAKSLKLPIMPFRDFQKLQIETALSKIPFVKEWVNDIIEEGKVIIFAHHHAVISALKIAFEDCCVVFDGNTQTADRMAVVDRFQNDDGCRVFIGSITAAGVGLTLTAASRVIFVEIYPVPGIMIQAEDRAHRIGQRDSVLVSHVVMDGTIDARLVELLLEKQAVLDGVHGKDEKHSASGQKTNAVPLHAQPECAPAFDTRAIVTRIINQYAI